MLPGLFNPALANRSMARTQSVGAAERGQALTDRIDFGMRRESRTLRRRGRRPIANHKIESDPTHAT
jgi:hypothetical protein